MSGKTYATYETTMYQAHKDGHTSLPGSLQPCSICATLHGTGPFERSKIAGGNKICLQFDHVRNIDRGWVGRVYPMFEYVFSKSSTLGTQSSGYNMKIVPMSSKSWVQYQSYTEVVTYTPVLPRTYPVLEC